MIKEHCYQPGDQVQSGNHVYRLEEYDHSYRRWWARQEQSGPRLLVAGIKCITVPVMIQYEFYTAYTKVRSGGGLERIKDERCRPMDADNAISAMKPFQDLLVKDGHIPGDEARYVSVAPPIIHSAKESGVTQGVKVWFLNPEEWRKRCR